MFGAFVILAYLLFFLGANGQDLDDASSESSSAAAAQAAAEAAQAAAEAASTGLEAVAAEIAVEEATAAAAGNPCTTSWGSSCSSVTQLLSGPICPDGFDQVENYCFKISDEVAFWDESKQRCEELNAKLAEPKEFLNNNNVFAKYLWKNLYDEDYYVYEDHQYYAGDFIIGGQFTNNSWKWLSGGDVINQYITNGDSDDLRCLDIYIYSDIYDYYSDDYYSYEGFENIQVTLYGIPCNNIWAEYKSWESAPHRYICQAPFRNTSYSTCEQSGNKYASGQLLPSDIEQCEQNWCQDGIIQQYTCGNITTGCCEYKRKLYGDGDRIGPTAPTEDCSGCQQRVCQAGVIQWQSCANCSIKCCFFNGASYKPGSSIESVCTRLVCNGTTGQFNYQGIDYTCPRCKVYLDPHIVTYDRNSASCWSCAGSYSYQGCGNYSLSQIGRSYNSTLATYATFVPCGGSSEVTCVEIVTFKIDEHTVITIGSNPGQFQVNGNNYTVPSSSPSIVQVLNTVYPVLAWTSSNCVVLQGFSGLLIKFCWSSWANHVYVWADSGVAGGLMGLCGTVNDDVNDDFTTRNGTIVSPWQRDPPEEFPLSWLASNTSNGNCNGINDRKKRQAENKCDNSSVLYTFYSQCNTTVTSRYPDADPEEAQTIIDDCVFDLCNVSDPDAWIEAVQEAAQVQAEIQEDTLNCFWLGELHPQNTTRTGECGEETCEAGSWVLDISTSTCITGATTESPTTEAPTTEAPTTEAPTPEAPTTVAHTTADPSTDFPSTKNEVPTTIIINNATYLKEAATTEAPTTEAPTTESPTTEAIVAYTTEDPSTDFPSSKNEVPTTIIIYNATYLKEEFQLLAEQVREPDPSLHNLLTTIVDLLGVFLSRVLSHRSRRAINSVWEVEPYCNFNNDNSKKDTLATLIIDALQNTIENIKDEEKVNCAAGVFSKIKALMYKESVVMSEDDQQYFYRYLSILYATVKENASS